MTPLEAWLLVDMYCEDVYVWKRCVRVIHSEDWDGGHVPGISLVLETWKL